MCETSDGFECVRGSLYNDQVRVARPVCECGCHLLPGERRKRGNT